MLVCVVCVVACCIGSVGCRAFGFDGGWGSLLLGLDFVWGLAMGGGSLATWWLRFRGLVVVSCVRLVVG